EGDKAVTLVRGHATRKDARPTDLLLLVRYLARQKQAAEALAVCEQAWTACPAEAVSATSVVVLRTAGAADKDCRKVEGRIREALKQNPDSVALRMHLADLQDLRERYDDQ